MARLRYKSWAKDYLHNSEYVLDIDTKIEDKEILELEIGMGKGDFILKKAIDNPKIKYYGMEKYPSVLVIALKKIEEQKEEINNLKLIDDFAMNLLNYFPKKSINNIYINFPDPWPKTRNAKRRLLHRDFLELYFKLLKNEGKIFFKTDQLPLFEFALEEIKKFKKFKLLRVENDLHKAEEVIYKTEYEKKFISLNKKINYLVLEKA